MRVENVSSSSRSRPRIGGIRQEPSKRESERGRRERGRDQSREREREMAANRMLSTRAKGAATTSSRLTPMARASCIAQRTARREIPQSAKLLSKPFGLTAGRPRNPRVWAKANKAEPQGENDATARSAPVGRTKIPAVRTAPCFRDDFF